MRVGRASRAIYPALSVICALQVQGQEHRLPALGSVVPTWVQKARAGSETCATDLNHRDPCSRVIVRRIVFRVAWDQETLAVTFLFTKDHHFVTDSELGVEGGCRLVDESERPYQLTSYLGWLLTPAWSDSVQDVSGDAIWYAVLRKDSGSSTEGTIVGFVQSRYLRL